MDEQVSDVLAQYWWRQVNNVEKFTDAFGLEPGLLATSLLLRYSGVGFERVKLVDGSPTTMGLTRVLVGPIDLTVLLPSQVIDEVRRLANNVRRAANGSS